MKTSELDVMTQQEKLILDEGDTGNQFCVYILKSYRVKSHRVGSHYQKGGNVYIYIKHLISKFFESILDFFYLN